MNFPNDTIEFDQIIITAMAVQHSKRKSKGIVVLQAPNHFCLFTTIFDDAGIRTADLWRRKRTLCHGRLLISFLICFSHPLFLYFRLLYKQLTANKRSIKVDEDWIRTRVLWYWKQPLYKLCHNHCDQMATFLFNIWPFATTTIYSEA